ncbi:oxysterol-binding protein-related protein 9-like isoform X2 [Lytechinus variegatus]|uniref:oxysterol-binding protein-related protein 9-like isoform X2 n=1 Tax=Lytechinus variegatus TaxID=7654 RepID=UPI001BB1335A|nr:oxysterol-binding protein-related protein 9-like isoform X2 [Lytechinus variegatus]
MDMTWVPDVMGAIIGIDDEDDSTFTVTVDQKTFHFQAQSAEEREQWVTALEETVLRHKQAPKYGLPLPLATPSVQDFERKLFEADAYLQILIAQVESLEDRISKLENAEERTHHEKLRENGKAMIESVKQAIVLLQVAKNTLNPVNGFLQPEMLLDDDDTTTANVPSQHKKGSPDASIDSAEEVLEAPMPHRTLHGPTMAATASPMTTAPLPMTRHPRQEIPALSYSSSDEDDFFDADEYQEGEDNDKVFHRNAEKVEERLQTRARQDSCPEEMDQDAIDCQKHGSIITHLLSQVRLGMDLTKVVLPTFILETRSLLEMYADFFAHPELFADISDIDNPKERMVQVVRWYLSAFHAGRQGSVAKKPYNPILGETFQCYWDLKGDSSDDSVKNEVPDGPVPWAGSDQVSFIAEQVSHHPPISAFYAECPDKQMSINGHIWTKSKFLGLSIGVEMVGQACCSDLKHEEEYIMTFPNGYGRSILTIPWFELGGKCTINCAKTGYSALVSFQTKPFYGGKKHRVVAEIKHVSDYKPFVTVEGEWNGVMTTKGPSGEPIVFVDTKEMKVNRKRVRPVEDQDPYESRKLWKDVTTNLKTQEIEAATDAKHFLEERQRREAKERLAEGTKWETKLFHEDGECWIYDNPLLKRTKTQKARSVKNATPSPQHTPTPKGKLGNHQNGIDAASPSRSYPSLAPARVPASASSPQISPSQELQDLLQ